MQNYDTGRVDSIERKLSEIEKRLQQIQTEVKILAETLALVSDCQDQINETVKSMKIELERHGIDIPKKARTYISMKGAY